MRKTTGTVVNDYQRGNGEPTESTLKVKKLVGKRIGKADEDKGHGGFEVFIKYANDQSKRVIYKERTYLSALPVGIGYADGQIRRITLRKMEPWTTEVKN